jgi:hypothetical protein
VKSRMKGTRIVCATRCVGKGNYKHFDPTDQMTPREGPTSKSRSDAFFRYVEALLGERLIETSPLHL